MSRTPVTVRAATLDDVPVLRELWGSALRRTDARSQEGDLAELLAGLGHDDRRSVVVAEYDGLPAGAVYLEATTLTPLNLEPVVLVISPHVLAPYRRKGVGAALMDAAVRFAEQHGIRHVAAGAVADSRDANRFMARLSLVPRAVLRVSTTQAVRGRLAGRMGVELRPASRHLERHIDKVLAARRGRRAERTPG